MPEKHCQADCQTAGKARREHNPAGIIMKMNVMIPGCRAELWRWFCLWFMLTVASSQGFANSVDNQGTSVPDGSVLIEAEQFAEYGGWVDDSQFMDQMGSPFLLAHGLGKPVQDAQTQVTFPQVGRYHVWVRTRDWVATWQASGSPGKFQLLIDGKSLACVFGTERAEWHWQDGGLVDIENRSVTVSLHDLTGFEGRCDAILFIPSDSLATEPPNDLETLLVWRTELRGFSNQPEDAGEFDLVVVGGGIAGTCAAVSAARYGLRVALIQDRPVLGGNNSSEVRVWLMGSRNQPPYRFIGSIVAELEQERRAHYGPANTADLYEDEKKIALVEDEPNISLRLLHRANAVEMEGKRITAVIAEHTRSGRRFRFRSRLVADCTGDGCIGALAGADFDMTVPGHMGRCNLWHAADAGQPVSFPRCPWALNLADRPFPGRENQQLESLGGWYWESGFDHDPFEKSEYIRDWNFRAAYGAWDTLKNVDYAFPNHELRWIAYVAGKRESRRLLGDVILTKQDLLSSRKFEDGCVPTGWKIDVHSPDERYERGFEGDAFIAKATFTDYKKPYWIPYRCLYSRNLENLFMAGRDISVTHDALGATRVMRTGGCMGEVVGIAASICIVKETTPRGVYQDYLELFQSSMRRPKYLGSRARVPSGLKGRVGRNVFLEAKVTVSGTYKPEFDAAFLNDGFDRTSVNEWRWISNQAPETWAEFRLAEPVTVTAFRLVTGFTRGGDRVGVVEDSVLQRRDGDHWIDIPATQLAGNEESDIVRIFEPVRASRFRLLVTRAPDNLARVWEIQLFATK
jgi:hypothetical protein